MGACQTLHTVTAARPRVLLVDDDDDMRELLTEVLALEGFDAIPCGSAEEAAERLDDADILVTDFHLPQATGLELCERAEEQRPGMPRVVLTGDGRMEAAVSHRAAFLCKPVAIPRLVATVRALVDAG